MLYVLAGLALACGAAFAVVSTGVGFFDRSNTAFLTGIILGAVEGGVPTGMFMAAAWSCHRRTRIEPILWTVVGGLWLGFAATLGYIILAAALEDGAQCIGATCQTPVWWTPTGISSYFTLAVAGFAVFIAPIVLWMSWRRADAAREPPSQLPSESKTSGPWEFLNRAGPGSGQQG
jgi:hypothetical protein